MDDHPTPPPYFLGYLFSVAFLVYEFATYDQPDEMVMALSIAGAAWVYYLWNVYVIHRVTLAKVDPDHFISPRKAVWSHFIPFYNAYWLYKWPNEFVYTFRLKFPGIPLSKTAVHACMGVGILLTRIDFAVGFALFWTGVVIIIRGLNRLSDPGSLIANQMRHEETTIE